jgi:hypothetical protein
MITRPRRPLAALALALAACAGGSARAAEWDFTVLLDGEPIGQHRFVIGGARERTVEIEAAFQVKLLGWTAYRYRHQARERWTGDCLASVQASTDDNGSDTRVSESFPAAPCTMSFAYWNPAIATQGRLFDAGTGVLRAVQVTALPPTTISVRGAPVAARGLRIAGLPQPIDVWYDGDTWIGLDTFVRGQRRLSYRLR